MQPYTEERLRKVMERIRTNDPARFVMTEWEDSGEPGTEYQIASEWDLPRLFPPCGAVMCIGGEAQVLFHGTRASALGLDVDEAQRLFELHGWPEQFQERWDSADTLEKRRDVALARCEHFLQTKGAE